MSASRVPLQYLPRGRTLTHSHAAHRRFGGQQHTLRGWDVAPVHDGSRKPGALPCRQPSSFHHNVHGRDRNKPTVKPQTAHSALRPNPHVYAPAGHAVAQMLRRGTVGSSCAPAGTVAASRSTSHVDTQSVAQVVRAHVATGSGTHPAGPPLGCAATILPDAQCWGQRRTPLGALRLATGTRLPLIECARFARDTRTQDGIHQAK